MPAIENLRIRKILDSRGNATVEVDVTAGAVVGRAAAPSRAVDEGIRLFRREIAAKLEGVDSAEQEEVDRILHAVDGTADFSRIGGNVAVATSLAVVKASAASARKPLDSYLGGARPPTL